MQILVVLVKLFLVRVGINAPDGTSRNQFLIKALGSELKALFEINFQLR